MNNRLDIILCASGHLPSGTSENTFDSLYNSEIKPLVLALNKFPQISMVFHYSGVILYWIERKHPEFFMLLEDLMSRKQVEFLGGGFYYPALPLLPLSDKIEQIDMLTTYLRKRFGKKPQGCWLPAMAWEQNLVGPLNYCGMSYTFLEELQFSGTGIKPNAAGTYSPCITEDQGKLLTVFPVAGSLGKELRKSKPHKFLEELSNKFTNNEDNEIMVIPIGGEALGESTSFGSMAGSTETVYEKLFNDLSNAGSRIRFTTTTRIFKNLKGLKKIYFHGAWTHSNGNETHPRQFLASYPEAGDIYAKMIYVHTLINNQLRGDKTRKRTALEDLWKAQDSGIFRFGSGSSPGLLHSPVRKAAYHSLLQAEKICREKSKFNPSLSVFDFNLDGEGEYLFQDDKLNCYVKSRGAGIFELDYLPAGWNYMDTLSTETAMHKIGKKRCAFADWLAPAGIVPKDARPEGIRGGRFCGEEDFEVTETDRPRRRVVFRLPPKAGLPWAEIEIGKTWQLKKNSLALEYALKNTGKESQAFTLCPSLDLSFPGTGEEFLKLIYYRENEKENFAPNVAFDARNIRILEIHDLKNNTTITLEANRNFDIRIFPISSGITGPGEYQSTCIMPLIPVSVEAGKMWKTAFLIRISS
ncbi:MAG: DUF1926 domain-containing protein [Treponema sp.]|jgi:hypothetical protein|nr:DUF1926 domain-containing protein [Treponema sp.]